MDAEFSSYRGFAAPRDLTVLQIAYWEKVFAAIDQDERWQDEAEKNLLHRQFRASRDIRKYLGELEVLLKAVLADLGMLK